MQNNVLAMATRIQDLGCTLRPHVKTHKSREVLAQVRSMSKNPGITVSTLREARYFFASGEKDILYAVALTPDKVSGVAALMREGCDLKVITDNVEAMGLLAEAARNEQLVLPVLIEIDVDGHRSGADPRGAALLDVARGIDASPYLELAGVMTHAGGAYDCDSLDDIKRHARQERALTVESAQRIRALGIDCPMVSIGSTPTAMVVDNLEDVTEVRPGVYTFFDLFQAGLGVADLNDIALSVLTTVIGHQKDKARVIVDAGWMAMSRDRGTASQAVDQGYGLVCGLDGVPLSDVIMGAANQEHGIITAREGMPPLDTERFCLGSKWRILPNHACATAAQFPSYQVLENDRIVAEWARTSGW